MKKIVFYGIFVWRRHFSLGKEQRKDEIDGTETADGQQTVRNGADAE